tara:strand:- start:408 stop:518 length:111 start_codon:yes stop_codon:yes gene_type:complete
MTLGLEGKIALATGASSGLGKATTIKFQTKPKRIKN